MRGKINRIRAAPVCEVSAAIFSNGAVTAYSRGGGYDNLPICIKDWITQVNSGHKDRFEQPQNVRMAGE